MNDTIHDFYGFPSEFYQIEYPALGIPELAQRTANLINNKGFDCEIDYTRGLDHGAWVPAMLMYPTIRFTNFTTFNTATYGSRGTSRAR